MARLNIILMPEERRALVALAERERRNLRDQAAILLRERLIERGLLPSDDLSGQPTRMTEAQQAAARS